MALNMAGAPTNRNMAEIERELAVAYGFVPDLFRAQGPIRSSIPLWPACLAQFYCQRAVWRIRKRHVCSLPLAGARGNEYCAWAIREVCLLTTDSPLRF